jgi:hypothetical protein
LRIRLYRGAKWEPQERAVFHYGDVEYCLKITDRAFVHRRCQGVPDVDEPPKEFALPCGDRCLLCLSLTGDFQGFHYKIAATVFEDR